MSKPLRHCFLATTTVEQLWLMGNAVHTESVTIERERLAAAIARGRLLDFTFWTASTLFHDEVSESEEESCHQKEADRDNDRHDMVPKLFADPLCLWFLCLLTALGVWTL